MTQHHAHAAAPNNAAALVAATRPGPAPATAARPTQAPATVPAKPAAPPPALARVIHDGAATAALGRTMVPTGKAPPGYEEDPHRLEKRHRIATHGKVR